MTSFILVYSEAKSSSNYSNIRLLNTVLEILCRNVFVKRLNFILQQQERQKYHITTKMYTSATDKSKG